MEPEYLLQTGGVPHQVYGAPPKPVTNKKMIFSKLLKYEIPKIATK
jgi:hypothetical protein